MSGFTTETLEKKLAELNNSQQSIQTLSLWLIHHRKHNKLIVQTWYKELKKVKPQKRLIFMYLANDVIQNSRKKGPEFTKEFISPLKHAFEFVARDAEEKIVQSLERIITIWSERNLYDPKLLNEFRMNLKNGTSNLSAVGGTPSSVHSSQSEKVKKRKEKGDEPVDGSPSKKIKPVLLSHSDAELSVKGEDVDSKELVNCLRSLENTASSDAAIRERIAKLPPEVSDASYIDKLRDKNEAEQLSLRVDNACSMLSDYNGRLAKELEERKKISHKLAAFCRYQRELQEQIQKTLTEYAERLRKVKQVRTELKLHLLNLPDLDKLPSLNEAPLPKPSDLFLSSNNAATKREDEKSNDSIENDSSANDSSANDAHNQNGLRPGADESARSEESARGDELSRGDEMSRSDELVRGDESVPGADQTDRPDSEFQRAEPSFETTKSAVSA